MCRCAPPSFSKKADKVITPQKGAWGYKKLLCSLLSYPTHNVRVPASSVGSGRDLQRKGASALRRSMGASPLLSPGFRVDVAPTRPGRWTCDLRRAFSFLSSLGVQQSRTLQSPHAAMRLLAFSHRACVQARPLVAHTPPVPHAAASTSSTIRPETCLASIMSCACG